MFYPLYISSRTGTTKRERERKRAAGDRFISRPAKVFAYISSNYYGRVSKNYAGPLMDRAVVLPLPRCFEKFFSADNFSPMGENSLPVPAGRETEGDESFFPPTPVKSLSVVTINNLSRNNNVPPGDSPLPRGVLLPARRREPRLIVETFPPANTRRRCFSI